MAKKKAHTYSIGDKVKLAEPPQGKTKPVRIGDTVDSGYFAAVHQGNEGVIKYGQVYQVTGKKDVTVVDNNHRPLPLINKNFVNNPVFKGLFIAVKDPDKTNNKNED